MTLPNNIKEQGYTFALGLARAHAESELDKLEAEKEHVGKADTFLKNEIDKAKILVVKATTRYNNYGKRTRL